MYKKEIIISFCRLFDKFEAPSICTPEHMIKMFPKVIRKYCKKNACKYDKSDGFWNVLVLDKLSKNSWILDKMFDALRGKIKKEDVAEDFVSIFYSIELEKVYNDMIEEDAFRVKEMYDQYINNELDNVGETVEVNASKYYMIMKYANIGAEEEIKQYFKF